MKLKLGKGKTNHQRKPADWDKNPIWVNDFDESNYDEEHEKPVVGVTNVNRDVLTAGLVTIALRLPDDTPACGYLSFPEGDKLQAVWIWHKSQWQEPHAIPSLKYPLRLQAVPTMKNKPVEFIVNIAAPDRYRRLFPFYVFYTNGTGNGGYDMNFFRLAFLFEELDSFYQ